MRLNLYWRGWDILDVELHAVRRRPADAATTEQQDAPCLRSSGTHNFERADPYGDPATTVGFGFQARG